MTPDQVVLAQASSDGDLTSRPWLVHGGRALPLAAVLPGTPAGDAPSIHVLLRAWSTVAPELRRTLDSPRTAADIRRRGIRVARLSVVAPVRPA